MTLAPIHAGQPVVERRAVMPDGFRAAGVAAGIKASGRPDVALIVASGGAVPAAAVFTPNRFAAAPVRLSRSNLTVSGMASAVVCTSGCANAATGAAGLADQERVGRIVSAAAGVAEPDVLHLSTGLIGTRLPLDRVEAGVTAAAAALDGSDAGLLAAAEAFRTTDSVVKVATTTFELASDSGSSTTIRVSGIAKGVGMIHPRMATMLSVVLTDASASPETLSAILRPAAARTWDQLTVDGDTSTNDTVFLLASGASGTSPVVLGTPAEAALRAAVEAVARDLARQQAADGEGATTLITCVARGARDDASARAIARAVVASSLVKAAVHGRDPNWGRIAGAAGNARLAEAEILEAAGLSAAEAARLAASPAELDPDRLRISIAGTAVFDGANGGPLPFDRSAVRSAMAAPEVVISLDLDLGDGDGEAFGCDLTETYVIENSEYTT
ncbi:MAG TPA: bifunctional ornithine acetyltransferase/N-acetylglutamate synthase [Candidatus Polarisedimenticolia bacterium]|nr:bifunctional ornithine acetyltransferase/N-acetylglutamate synthase [Candidatus Polarisedimenticolia bacterium]